MAHSSFPFHIALHPDPTCLSDEEGSSDMSNTSEHVDLQAAASHVLDDYQAANRQDDTASFFRIVLERLPKAGARNLMRELTYFNDHEDIRRLRQFFVDAVLKPLKYCNAESDIRPSPSPEAEDEIQQLMAFIDASSTDDQSKLKQDCLRRDAFCCLVTGVVDDDAVDKGQVVPGNRPVSQTQCAHIIPFGLREFDEDLELEIEKRATVWWALYRYFPALKGAIGPDSVNKPENAMTMRSDIHGLFAKYRFAFKPAISQNIPNRYHIHQFRAGAGSLDRVPHFVTFETADPRIEVPSADFLRVHFAVASILHVSGIGAEIDASRDDGFWVKQPHRATGDGSTNLGELVAKKLLIGI